MNFILEKLLFEPKVQWMRKAKYQWEFENLKVQLDKKSVSEYKDCEESQTILGLILLTI